MNYGWALLLTVVAELMVAACYFSRPSGTDRHLSGLGFVIGLNLLSHPLAWLTVGVGMAPWWAVETWVIGVEALALAAIPELSKWQAVKMALVMNVASASLSWMI